MRRSLPHPTVRTEHTPIDLTHTLLDFPALGCWTAPQRWAASADSTRCSCSLPHAKPASLPRLLSCASIHRECESFSPFSRRAFHSLEPVLTHSHFVTRTGCSFQSTDEAKVAPLCLCGPWQSKSTGHSGNSKLAHAGLASPLFPGPSCQDRSGKRGQFL